MAAPDDPMLDAVLYEVETPVFAGPFDLLLHLIVRDEVEIYDVSLSDIVDAYLAELARMEELDLDVATEFLLIAATLIELKSRRLLPDPTRSDLDDELALWEERDLLLARLLECKTFKDASVALERIAQEAGRSYPRTAGLEEQFVGLLPDVLEGVTPIDLREAYARATAPRPVVRVDLDHVAPIGISVADAVADLVIELPDRPRVTFRELTAQLVDRIEVVVHFLAILELYKRGLIELSQLQTFGAITIEWVGAAGELELDDLDVYEG